MKLLVTGGCGFIGSNFILKLLEEHEEFKITKELGWKINTTFDEGIKNTVQWYLKNPDILNNISSTVLDSTPWKSSN